MNELHDLSLHELKDIQRGSFIRVAQLQARHGGAWRLLCDIPVTEAEPGEEEPIVAEIPLFLTARAESTQKLVSLLIENLLRNTILLTFAEQRNRIWDGCIDFNST